MELCRFYGLPTIGSGSTTDAVGVDFQAGVEDVFLWLSVALAGAHGLVASSFVGGSRVLSPAKVLLDADAIRMMQHVLAGAAVDDESALLDDIAEVGPGGHFLGRNSTRARARSGELFEPRVLRRARAEAAWTPRSRPTPASAPARSSRRTRSFRCPTRRRGSWTRSSPAIDHGARAGNQECLTLVSVQHNVWRKPPPGAGRDEAVVSLGAKP